MGRLLFMIVAKRCQSPRGDEASDAASPQGLLVSSIPEEWRQVFGNDVSGLMDKCGYKDVDALVSAVDGLRVVGEGVERRVVTTRVNFEDGAAPSAPSASTDGALSSI